MIEAQGLTLQLGNFVLKDISLKLNDSEYFVLLGPSGSGKTVFIETLMGLHQPSSGSILIDGKDVTHLPPEMRRLGYIPQDFGLFPHLGVKDNLLFGVRAQGMQEPDLEGKLAEIVSLLEIDHLIGRKNIESLSGGEKQRVAIARALVTGPRVLFLDEPFSAVDEYLKQQLLIKLREIKKQLGVTMFHVTHNHQEAFFLGHRIGIMLGGRIVQVGTQQDVYYRPGSLSVASFLLTRNIFKGKIENICGDEAQVRCGKALLKTVLPEGMIVDEKVWLGIRPEEIRVEPWQKDWQTCSGGACNAFKASVKSRIDGFSGLLIECDTTELDRPVEISMQKNLACQDRFSAGAEVKICLNKKAIWLLPDDSK